MIRNATHDDIPTMIALGETMHAESRYGRFPWNSDKVASLIAELIDSDEGIALVYEQGGQMIGGFIGTVFEHYAVDSLCSVDYALYVSNDRRGAMIGAQLLGEYVRIAKAAGVPDDLLECGVSTGVAMDRTRALFEHCGFECAGYLMSYKGKA